MNFDEYVSAFDPLVRQIKAGRAQDLANYTKLITVDASPPDFWDFRDWPLLPQNQDRDEPCAFTPHLMRHLYRQPKFILIFRNPTSRLYSDYFFLSQEEELSAEDFHRDVEDSIEILQKCLEKGSIRSCFFSASLYFELPARIHFGCYSVFLKEWLDVFPKNHFLFLKTEEYTKNIKEHMLKIYAFLDLAHPGPEVMKNVMSMERSRVTVEKHRAGPMLPQTKLLLDAFYQPFNQELSEILQDEKYLWREDMDL